MILSKRERRIALATLLVLAVLGLDHFLLTPLQERRAETATQQQQALDGLERARAIFDRNRHLTPEWQEMLEAGLKAGPAEAESQILHALRQWCQETELSLSSLRPDKTTDIGKLREVTFRASGQGGMAAVAEFLWRLETSPLPLRVTELHLGARKEGTDDLSLQLHISALCQAADLEVKAASAVTSTQDEVKSDD